MNTKNKQDQKKNQPEKNRQERGSKKPQPHDHEQEHPETRLTR